MSKIHADRFLSALCKVTLILLCPFVLVMLGASFVMRVDFRQMTENDYPDIYRQDTLLLIAALFVVYAVFLLIRRRQDRRLARLAAALPAGRDPRRKKRRAALCLLLVFAGGLCLFLIFSIRGLATNDARLLDEITAKFMQGDLTSLRRGYLNNYPFQLGYMAVCQFLYKAVGPSRFIVYQLLNTAAILVTLGLLWSITWELYRDSVTCDLMALTAMGALFLYVYSTFVYADIWSLAPQTAALYLMVRYMRHDYMSDGVGAAFWTGVSCVLKTNCYIAMIAMAIACVLVMLREFTRGSAVKRNADRPLWRRAGAKLVVLVLLLVLGLGMPRAVGMAYVRAAGMDGLPAGVTAPAYFAMGMTETEGKYGWYNGDNVRYYTENGRDGAAENEAAWAAVREKAAYFREHPRYMVKFYLFKFLTQWGDASAVSMREFEETARHVEDQPAVAGSLVFGTGSRILKGGMEIYHAFVLLCLAAWIVHAFRRRQLSDPETLLVIFILGGMLFHQIWEASGRYTIRYRLTMLPLAARGLERITARLAGSDRKPAGTAPAASSADNSVSAGTAPAGEAGTTS